MENVDILIKYILMFLTGMFGFIIRRAFTRIDSVENKVSHIQLDVAKNYVGKADLHEFKHEILKRFDKLDDKLDSKE